MWDGVRIVDCLKRIKSNLESLVTEMKSGVLRNQAQDHVQVAARMDKHPSVPFFLGITNVDINLAAQCLQHQYSAHLNDFK